MELTTTMGKLTGDVQKDMKMLMNFVFNQTEEMRYLMHNLDVTNFNDLGLARYENGRMQIYTKALNVKAEELQVQIQNVEQTVKTEIKADLDGVKSTVTKQGQTITANSKDINTLKNTTIPELSSTIQQNADKIALVVKRTNGQNTINAAAIALSINEGGTEAQISADQISMAGSVKFLSAADVGRNGTTIIDGGRIQSGIIQGVTLQGVTLISESGIKSVKIENGAISFNYGGLIQNTNLRDLVIQCEADMRIGSTGSGALYLTSYGITWMLGVNGWEKV